MNNKKGISLIVLVITILVMIILAGVVIVSLQESNPIDKAKNAKLQDSVGSVRAAISQYAVQAQADESVGAKMAGIMKGGSYNPENGKITGTTACGINGYTAYVQLSDAADLKAKLGVDAASVEGQDDKVGTFFIDDKGASIFVLKDATIAKSLGIDSGASKTTPKETNGIVYGPGV